MSILLVRRAIETKLAAITPAIETAYENTSYTPTTGTPYQRAEMLPAKPDNVVMGAKFYFEQGIYQVTLCYPQGSGTGDAQARALLLQQTFRRASTSSSGGLSTMVSATPEIGRAYQDGDRYCIPVSIPYIAQVSL